MSAQVFGRPVDPKPANAGGALIDDTLKAVTNLTAQNRGNDALSLLQNAVDNGLILSDHKGVLPMNAQDTQNMQLVNGGQPVTVAQVMQVTARLCHARRGDDAVTLYGNAIHAGIIQSTP